MEVLVCLSLMYLIELSTNLLLMNRHGLSGAGGSHKIGSLAGCTRSGPGHLSPDSVAPCQRILHPCISNVWEAGRDTGEGKQTIEIVTASLI